MKKFVIQWYDPPSGWKYGFPKSWPQGLECSDATLEMQLIKDGYPKHMIPLALNHTRFGGSYEESN